ncbi:MAG: Suppressor of cytokine signaling [Rhodobacteraceae bacterium HLUCCA12]|nr:MAG: Suppressor of cytokine signaling [Rhodobacteraceae bacterium HLUCCA12]
MLSLVRTAFALTAGCAVLAGCAQMPDLPGFGAQRNAPRAAVPDTDSATDDSTPGAVPASTAERACTRQGQDQGLSVQGVVGTREVMGDDGVPRSRDVMLRVARGEQVYEVRCSYSYVSSEARIMSL